MSISDPTIIALFQNAPPFSRREFLTALSSHLHPSDWNHLHSLLCKRSYYIDFLTLLPLEVSLQIIQYLSLEQTILLRSVSRRWNSLLTSPETCRSLTRYFFPLYADTHLDPVIHFENLTSRRLSFLRGNPSHTEEISFEASCFDADTSTFAFLTSENQILVRNLLNPLSPPLLQKYMHDRSQVTRVTLSGTLVAAFSRMSTCQVWDLSTHSTHYFNIPNPFIPTVHSNGNTIAFIPHKSDLIIHNAVTKKTRAYPLNPVPYMPSLIVHEASNRLWIVELTPSGENNVRISSRNLETGDIIGTTENFTLDASIIAMSPRYAGNGIWNIETFKRPISPLGLELSQIRIDVGHTQTISFKSYTVALPKVPIWEPSPPEPYGIYGLCIMLTWGDISWIYGSTSKNSGDYLRIAWEHRTMEVMHGGTEKFVWADDPLEAGWNDRFIVLVHDFWESRPRVAVVMRFDGIHERLEREPPAMGADLS